LKAEFYVINEKTSQLTFLKFLTIQLYHYGVLFHI